jgi:hypothetical protein
MSPLKRWYAYMQSHDRAELMAMLADDVVFHSPVVHTPQRGKAITFAYLHAADETFQNSQFTYTREFECGTKAVLEFEAELDGIKINGIDMIVWNAEGLITDFKVMVRPLKAVNMLHAKMAEQLAKAH